MKIRSLAATAALVAATLVGASPAVAAQPAAAPAVTATPTAEVHPAAGLTTSSTVTVSATGLPANIDVNLVECDVQTNPNDEGDGTVGCPTIRVVTTSATGKISEKINPANLVYRSEEHGDPFPVYCRADICHYYVEWTDADGLHSVATGVMKFSGSPATIAAATVTGLHDGQKVKVTGSAHGSAGRYVTIEEISCVELVQGHFCNGALPLVSVPLTSGGTFSVTTALYRFLSDGEDCVDNYYGCQLIAVTLGPDGQPDLSFGDPGYADPGVYIDFVAS